MSTPDEANRMAALAIIEAILEPYLTDERRPGHKRPLDEAKGILMERTTSAAKVLAHYDKEIHRLRKPFRKAHASVDAETQAKIDQLLEEQDRALVAESNAILGKYGIPIAAAA